MRKLFNISRKKLILSKDLSKFEKIRKFSLLSKPFSVENGELSPKMSIKRHIVERNYAEIINRMYNED
jgi:long-chain acyl-CoA synthetase